VFRKQMVLRSKVLRNVVLDPHDGRGKIPYLNTPGKSFVCYSRLGRGRTKCFSHAPEEPLRRLALIRPLSWAASDIIGAMAEFERELIRERRQGRDEER
jgi:hypothetical protein